MKRPRRNHSPVFKAKVVLDALRGDKTLAELATKHDVVRQCELLELSRSSTYYTPRTVSESDLTLMRRLDKLHLAHPFLGARKLARRLGDEGHRIGRRHVRTLMRRMGMETLTAGRAPVCRRGAIRFIHTCSTNSSGNPRYSTAISRV